VQNTPNGAWYELRTSRDRPDRGPLNVVISAVSVRVGRLLQMQLCCSWHVCIDDSVGGQEASSLPLSGMDLMRASRITLSPNSNSLPKS
jgi:hypothetical protein